MSQMDDAINNLSEEELDLLNSDPQMLAAFKAKYSAAPSVVGMVGDLAKKILPSPETLEAPMNASAHLGKMVEAGGSGIGDLVANNGLPQASQDVQNVMSGLSPETTAGKWGKGVGSFFTPNQIALQAAGGAAAEPIANALGVVGSKAASILPSVTKFAPKFASSVVPEALQTSPEALAALAKNPSAITSAASMPETAAETGNYLKGIAQQGQQAAKAARSALSNETPVEGVVDVAKNGFNKLISSDIEAPGAKDTLNGIIKSLQKDPSEQNVQMAIDKIRDIVPQNTSDLTQAQKILDQLDSQFSGMLKKQNLGYAKGMAESSATRGPLKTLQSNLGVRQGQPGDWTIKALSKLNNPDALATQRALTALPGGTQLAGNAANAAAKAALQQSLAGKAALWGIPRVNPAIQGGVQAIPGIGNAVYQGLAQ